MQTITIETTRASISESALKLSFQVMTHCPATNRLTIRDDKEPLEVPGGQATWWRCSACNGWHVVVEDD